MARAPRDPNEPILDRFLAWRVVFVSLLLVAAVFGIYLYAGGLGSATDTAAGGSEVGEATKVARTAAVNMLVAGEIAYLLNTRLLLGSSISWRGFLGSRPALIAIGLVLAAQILWTYTGPMQFLFDSADLPLIYWSVIAGAMVTIFLIVEAEKALWRRGGTWR